MQYIYIRLGHNQGARMKKFMLQFIIKLLNYVMNTLLKHFSDDGKKNMC